jgi:hypothetical protein
LTPHEFSKSVDEIMAHHEAGHAVAALALGIPFTNVTLSGVRVKPSAFDLTNPYDIERDAMFTLAGESAEACVHEDAGHTSDDDQRHFEELCVDRHPENQERRAGWRLEMHRKTDVLVQQHWSSIELLAAYLLRNGSLSHAEVVEHLKWKLVPNQHVMVWNGDL